MARLIIHNDSKSGDLLIDSNGVRPITPFEKTVIAHLNAVSNLLQAVENSTNQEDGIEKDLLLVLNKLSNLAVERLESIVGPLDAVDSVVYLGNENGFACGSNGAPPRQLKVQSSAGGVLQDIAETRLLLTSELTEFLRRATEKGFGIEDIFETPAWVAEAIGLKLSNMTCSSLKLLAPSEIHSFSNSTDRELIGFFHKVVADGRYLETWFSEPVTVAGAIGAQLSEAAVDRILGSHSVIANTPEIARLSIQQGITVGIVAIAVLDHPGEVADRSLVEKF